MARQQLDNQVGEPRVLHVFGGAEIWVFEQGYREEGAPREVLADQGREQLRLFIQCSCVLVEARTDSHKETKSESLGPAFGTHLLGCHHAGTVEVHRFMARATGRASGHPVGLLSTGSLSKTKPKE